MAEDMRNTPEQEEEKVEKIDLGASLRKERKDKKPVNKKLVLIVTLVCIVVVAALAVALPMVLTPKDQQDAVVDLTVDLANYTSDDVTRVTVEGENTFTITRKGTGEEAVYTHSLLTEDKLYDGSCNSAFIQAATFTADQLVEENAADLTPYGLDKPTAVVTAEYADGNKVVVELGGKLDMSGQTYAKLQGSNNVYIFSKYLTEIFGGDLSRYRSLDIPEVSTDLTSTRSVIIRLKGEEQIRFLPVDDDGSVANTWEMTEPTQLYLDAAKLGELIDALATAKLYKFHGTHEDLAAFGLDEPWFEVIISDLTGAKKTFSLGGLCEEDAAYYCKIDDSGDVFSMYRSYTDMFENFSVNKYLDAFTNIVSINTVERMEVTANGKVYSMAIDRQEQYDENGELLVTATGKTDYLENFYLDGKEVQEAAFKTAYQSIIGVTISNLAEEELVDMTAAPALTVQYFYNDGSAPMLVEYLPYDINNYCVRKNGVVQLICKKELVDNVASTMIAFENGELNEEEK